MLAHELVMELLEGRYIPKRADEGAQKWVFGLRWTEDLDVESWY